MNLQAPRIGIALPLFMAGTADLTADTLKVPAQFATIQAAVDAAQPGDVVDVDEGYYPETITVGTAAITMTGDDAAIDASYAGPCVTADADDFTIRGFHLCNGPVGALIFGDRARIEENEFSSMSSDGILLIGDDATIAENEFVSLGTNAISYVSATSTSVTRIERNEIDLCGNTAIEATGGRIVVTKNSRAKITTTNQVGTQTTAAGKRSSITRTPQTRILSAKGSAIRPNAVT